MKWYIIRHGDKEKGNFHNPILRHQDQPISEKGQAEAKNLVPFFNERTISAIYISEYKRTGQTIAPTAETLKLTPNVDSRLNEIAIGAIEGLTNEEIEKQYPEVWQAYKVRNRDFQFPDGESGEQATERIKSFFEEKQRDNKDIILVAHDGWIRLLLCYLLGIPVYRRWEFQVDTCGIMEIEFRPEYANWKIIRFNHICK
jgi:broad specificity phosphatase PhoE